MAATSSSTPRIVVGVDESEGSRRALRWAGRLAEWTGARLDIVSTWHRPPGPAWNAVPYDWDPTAETQERVQALVDDVLGANRADVTVSVCESAPGRELVKRSAGALMLVVGSRGLGGFSGMLLGSVSAKVVEHAKCPVVVVRGDTALPVA